MKQLVESFRTQRLGQRIAVALAYLPDLEWDPRIILTQ